MGRAGAETLMAVLLSAALGSCTSVQYQADRLDEHLGRATREDVAASFGPPDATRPLDGGGTEWVYRYSQTVIGGVAAVGRRTCWENVLTFDHQGILRERQVRGC